MLEAWPAGREGGGTGTETGSVNGPGFFVTHAGTRRPFLRSGENTFGNGLSADDGGEYAIDAVKEHYDLLGFVDPPATIGSSLVASTAPALGFSSAGALGTLV